MNKVVDVEPEQTQTFHKVSYHGVHLDQLLAMAFPAAVAAAQRPAAAVEAALEAPVQSPSGATTHKEASRVKMHLWDGMLLPETMDRDSMVGDYKGKTFTQVGTKAETTSHYLGKLPIAYKSLRSEAGRAAGAAHSCFLPLE